MKRMCCILWRGWFLVLGLCLVSTGSAQIAARKIRPSDILSIKVVGEPELTLNKRVGDDGKITYPWLGELLVTGKTIAEVERELQDALDRDYIVNPQVTVEYFEYVKQFVTVLGEVNRAGPVELPPDRRMDVIQAIAAAGDRTRQAKKTLTLVRAGTEIKLNYDTLRKDMDEDKRVYVEPDDVIHVGERLF